MTSSVLLATFLLAGQDPEPDSIPKGPPPRLMALPGGGVGTMVVAETVQVPVNITKTVVVEEGGKKVTRAVTETVMQTVTRHVRVSLTGAKGRTAGGKKLDADALAKALARPQVVAVSADGKPVDAAYMRLLKPDTLVLELTGGTGAGGAAPLMPAIGIAPLPVPPPAVAPLPKKVLIED